MKIGDILCLLRQRKDLTILMLILHVIEPLFYLAISLHLILNLAIHVATIRLISLSLDLKDGSSLSLKFNCC